MGVGVATSKGYIYIYMYVYGTCGWVGGGGRERQRDRVWEGERVRGGKREEDGEEEVKKVKYVRRPKTINYHPTAQLIHLDIEHWLKKQSRSAISRWKCGQNRGMRCFPAFSSLSPKSDTNRESSVLPPLYLCISDWIISEKQKTVSNLMCVECLERVHKKRESKKELLMRTFWVSKEWTGSYPTRYMYQYVI